MGAAVTASEISDAPHGADELVQLLAARSDPTPIAELPEHLRDPNVLTVAADDRLVEFCRRRHCHVGPVSSAQLRIERGWEAKDVIGTSGKPLTEILTDDTARDERIRLHMRATASGRIRASKLAVRRLEAARAISEQQVRDAAARVIDVPSLLVWARTVGAAGWRRHDGTSEPLIPDGPTVYRWLLGRLGESMELGQGELERVACGEIGLSWHGRDPLAELVRIIEQRFPKAAAYLPADVRSESTTRLDQPEADSTSGETARRWTWQEAKKKGERYVKRHGYPGLRALAREIGNCPSATMAKAINKSPYLAARKAEHGYAKAPREVQLSQMDIDKRPQTTEPDMLQTLIREQDADAQQDRGRARSRTNSNTRES